MDFGKLPPHADLSRVDFRLPALPPAPVLTRSGEAAGPRGPADIHVGAPIWSQKQWLGRVYPQGTRPQDFMSLYTRQFNGIELNTTHYHIPTPEAVSEWRRHSPPGFRFSPKFPQEISHHRELLKCEPLTDAFCNAVGCLGDRLGAPFLQLSPGFGPDRLNVLEEYLETLPPGFPLCVEFRHPRWFNNGRLRPDAVTVLEKAGAGTVITDTAGRRDVVHANLSAPRVLIRFVGNQLDSTDYSRIDAWVERLVIWLDAGLRELFFYIHQPDNDVAPELISYFIEKLNATGRAALKDWERKDRGTQLGLFG
jgi:uncharacterized protein YecE (DUF72 family)